MKNTFTKLFLFAFFIFSYSITNAQPFGRHLTFDGVGNYAKMQGDMLIPDTSDFTLEFYFKHCATSGFLFDGLPSTAGRGIHVRYNGGGLEVSMRNSGGPYSKIYTVTHSTNEWHHFALVHSITNDSNYVYLDGDTIGTFVQAYEFQSGTIYTLGSSNLNSPSSLYKGEMDEFRVSTNMRYSGSTFTVPTAAFTPDAFTSALYHFNEAASASAFVDATTNISDFDSFGGLATKALPTVSGDGSACYGDTLTLIVSGDFPGTYSWSPTSGLSDPTNDTTSTIVAGNASYVVTVTYANTCTDQDSAIIIQYSPNVTVSSPMDSICSTAGSITLTVSPAGGTLTGPGIAGLTFNPATAGIGTHNIIYTYVDSNNCSAADTIQIQVIVCTDIAAIDFTNLQLFPNPANDVLTISNQSPIKTIVIYNSLGQIVYNSTFENNNTNIKVDINSLNEGNYIVEIVSANNAVTHKKFVKIK